MIEISFRSGARSVVLCVCLFALTGLQGCALPGMYAKFQNAVPEDAEGDEAAAPDYTVLKITPKLVGELATASRELATQEAAPLPFPTENVQAYKLGAQDVLSILVWGQPDLSPATTSASGGTGVATAGRLIDFNGDLYFPLVGYIRAAGLTVSEFREALTRQLSKFVKNPQIDVNVASYRSQRVFVSGEVHAPGVVSVTDAPLRIVDALAQVGGPSPDADISAVLLTRGKTSATINLEKLYYAGDTSANILLRAGDVLTVPDRQYRKVFVLGEVGVGAGGGRSLQMRRSRMTLAEILTEAGGPSATNSAAGEVYLMRADQNGKPLVYQLDAREPQSLLLAEQFTVQPRDVIYVNPTGLTRLGRFVVQFFPYTQAANSVNAIK